MTDLTEVGRALSQRRLDVVGSIAEAAEAADVDESTAVDIELGRLDRVSFAAFERYCEVVGLDVVLQERGR